MPSDSEMEWPDAPDYSPITMPDASSNDSARIGLVKLVTALNQTELNMESLSKCTES